MGSLPAVRQSGTGHASSHMPRLHVLHGSRSTTREWSLTGQGQTHRSDFLGLGYTHSPVETEETEVSPAGSQEAFLSCALGPLNCIESGSRLLDGIRGGVTRHGWTMPELVRRTGVSALVLRPVMDWEAGRPAGTVVWWAVVLDTLAISHGRVFHCVYGRFSLQDLSQVARSLLRKSGSTWGEFMRNTTCMIPGGMPVSEPSAKKAADPIAVLDRLAMAAGVAPVLISA